MLCVIRCRIMSGPGGDCKQTRVKCISAKKILEGLKKLREDDVLFDAELQVDGKIFKVHKNLLAAVSPYFRGMFSGRFKESDGKPIVLHDISSCACEIIVGCLYTAELKLSTENLSDVLSAAHLFQMDNLVSECQEFILQNMRAGNILKFLKLAEKYSLDACTDKANQWILKNFGLICKTNIIKDISKEALCKYIESNDLQVPPGGEKEIFMAAKQWIKHSPNRLLFAPEVLGHIRFASIPLDVLCNEIAKDPLVTSNAICHQYIIDTLKYHAETLKQPLVTGNMFEPRGHPGILFIPQGEQTTDSDGRSTYKIKNAFMDVCFTPVDMAPHKAASKPNKWQECKPLDVPMALQSMSAVTVGNFLFLFGTDSRSFSSVSLRYNPIQDSWMTLASVPRQATIGSVAVQVGEKRILLVGGMYVDSKSEDTIRKDFVTSGAYLYDISTDTWEKTANYPKKMVFAGATATCTPKGEANRSRAYIAGGVDEQYGTAFRHMHKFDLLGKAKWEIKPSMLHGRCQFIMECVEDKIYILGGISMHCTWPVDSDFLESIEMYDINAGQWSEIQEDVSIVKCEASVLEAASLVKGGRIMILGGKRKCNPSPETLFTLNTKSKVFYSDPQIVLPHGDDRTRSLICAGIRGPSGKK